MANIGWLDEVTTTVFVSNPSDPWAILPKSKIKYEELDSVEKFGTGGFVYTTDPNPPKPPKTPASPPVWVDQIQVTRAQVQSAVDLLTQAKSNSVIKILGAAGHPLAAVDYHALAKVEFTLDPALAVGPDKTKNAFLRHLNKVLDGKLSYLTPGPGGVYPPTVAHRRVETYDNHGMRTYLRDIANAYGNGRIIGRGASTMGQDTVYEWLSAWLSGDLKAAYDLEAAHSTNPHPLHPGAPGHPLTHKVVWAAAVPGEIPAGASIGGDWPSPQLSWTPAQVDNYLLYAKMANPTHLTGTQRSRWAHAHLRADKHEVDELSLTAQHRATKGECPLTAPPKMSNDAFTDQPMFEVLIVEGVVARKWPTGALDTYLQVNKLTAGWRWQSQVAAVQAHLTATRAEVEAAEHTLQLRYAPNQPKLGGYHRKTVLLDQFDRRWLFKPAPTPQTRFRPEVEHEAHELARIWGYRTAHSALVEYDGHYGQIQLMLDVQRNLLGTTGADFAALTPAQLITIAREHLLDWALDNDDTHGENIVILADNDPVGIDKGRAWRYVGGWDGLSATSTANSNCQLIYTALYDAIADGHLDRAIVDRMYRAVIVQAHRMQALPDAVLHEHLVRATANRPHYQPSSYQKVIPGAPTTAAELITQITDRKNALVADMTTLWRRVYDRAGWDQPDLDFPLGFNNQGVELHAGLHHPALHTAVQSSKSFGTAAMVAGTGVEDGHVLLWREHRPDGGVNIRGQFKARADAYDQMESWCHTTHKTLCVDPHVQPQPLYDEANFYHSIAKAGIAVAEANQGGSTIYLNWHITRLKEAMSCMERVAANARQRIDAGDPDPEGRILATVAMCELYQDYANTILMHRANRTVARSGDMPRHQWTPPQPAPPPAVNYTIQKSVATRAAAHDGDWPQLHPDTGELHLGGKLLTGRGAPGYMYLITLPTGEEIEFRAGTTTETPLTLKGLTQFTIRDADTMADSLHRIAEHLALMGCPLEPATRDDLELFYWRHLAGILADRADTRKEQPLSAQYKPFWKLAPSPGLAPADELASWRAAYAAATSPELIDTTLATGTHLPQFQHPDLRQPGLACGKPHWNRFDVTTDEWTQLPPPVASFRNGPTFILATGASLSTDARIRALAIWKAGQSSTDDLTRGSGSFIFTRVNRAQAPGYNIFFSPRTLTRTSTYSFGGDFYGRLDCRREHSQFAFAKHAGWTEDANEAMVKDMIALLDDIEILIFKTTSQRREAIRALAKLGIANIRGLPVTARLIASSRQMLNLALTATRTTYTRP